MCFAKEEPKVFMMKKKDTVNRNTDNESLNLSPFQKKMILLIWGIALIFFASLIIVVLKM